MQAFTNLFRALDETTKTSEKISAMVDYFSRAPAEDAAWAVYFLSGRKPRQVVPVRKLAGWALECANIPDWLFDECYDAVGDLAETVALLLPRTGQGTAKPLHYWVEEILLPLRDMEEQQQKVTLLGTWEEMNSPQNFVWNKLVTGGFRVGVSQQLVIRALAEVSGVEAATLAHRLMGEWEPSSELYYNLMSPDTRDADISQPYPFFLAHPLETGADPLSLLADLGPISQWQSEWKWDGIRAQVICRAGKFFLWSRGEELVTERYPELEVLGWVLPRGTVLDGELLPWKDGTVLPFAQLQRRIGRKTVSKKLMHDVPVVLMAYDVLEIEGVDVRDQPLLWRRQKLGELVAAAAKCRCLMLSPLVLADSWEELAHFREQSRQRNVEGLMLKRLNSPYRVGRLRGDWWKWKIDPLTIDAVLIHAQPGHGKRASLFTDYTFGIWDGDKLVPIAKAYSGLTDEEIRQVDAFVRENTLEKFGPVRTVKPQLVFELGFEGLQRSTRHKSGIAVRFPRMLRWRLDKTIEEADTLDSVKQLLGEEG